MRHLLLAALLLAAPAARAAESAAAALERYDEIMGPAFFEGDFAMTAHRSDGSERTYEMHVMKAGDDKFRAIFYSPPSAKGQEILRVGDNFWVYMPNLKRAVRLAARESFMGGDFNNADVLRVNYAADYDATIAKAEAGKLTLELKAKTPASAYDRIVLVVGRKDSMPIEGHFFAASGKELRSAVFSDAKDYAGHVRPAVVLMKNEIEPAKWSRMTVKSFKVVPSIPATKFVLTELGK